MLFCDRPAASSKLLIFDPHLRSPRTVRDHRVVSQREADQSAVRTPLPIVRLIQHAIQLIASAYRARGSQQVRWKHRHGIEFGPRTFNNERQLHLRTWATADINISQALSPRVYTPSVSGRKTKWYHFLKYQSQVCGLTTFIIIVVFCHCWCSCFAFSEMSPSLISDFTLKINSSATAERPCDACFAQISDGRGRRPPTTAGVSKLEWLPFGVVSKYPQCIVWFCHKARVWQTDRWRQLIPR